MTEPDVLELTAMVVDTARNALPVIERLAVEVSNDYEALALSALWHAITNLDKHYPLEAS